MSASNLSDDTAHKQSVAGEVGLEPLLRQTYALLERDSCEYELREWEAYVGPTDAPIQVMAPMSTELVEHLRDPAFWRALDGAERLPDGPWSNALRHKAQRLCVDRDPEVLELANRVDAVETAPRPQATPGRGVVPGDEEELMSLVTRLFARREQLARALGCSGYVECALRAEGPELEDVQQALRWLKRDLAAEPLSTAVPSGPPVMAEAARALRLMREAFAPHLDHLDPVMGPQVRTSGFCKVPRWPEDIRVAVRVRGVAALDGQELALLLHELGHAYHFRLMAAEGVPFPGFLHTPTSIRELFAELGERLVQDVDFLGALGVPASTAGNFAELQHLHRTKDMRRHSARVAFELDAYALAADHPGQLQQAYEDHMTAFQVPLEVAGHWSRDGYGFYTEDPMARHAYALARAWSQALSLSWQRMQQRTAQDALRDLARDWTQVRAWLDGGTRW